MQTQLNQLISVHREAESIGDDLTLHHDHSLVVSTMSTATTLKFQNDAKQMAAKRLQERKKGLLVLILRHLADSGYIDTYKKLETEASLSLEQVPLQAFPTIMTQLAIACTHFGAADKSEMSCARHTA